MRVPSWRPDRRGFDDIRIIAEVGNVVADPGCDCGLERFVEIAFVGQHRNVVEKGQVDSGLD